jgi:type III secretion protein C
MRLLLATQTGHTALIAAIATLALGNGYTFAQVLNPPVQQTPPLPSGTAPTPTPTARAAKTPARELLLQTRLGADKRVAIDSRDSTITQVLTDLMGDVGLPVIVDESIKGTVSGRFEGTRQRVLDDICRQQALSWYFDGGALYVTRLSAIATRMVWMETEAINRLSTLATDLGLLDGRYVYTPVPTERYALMTGPPRYLQRMLDLAKTIGAQPKPESQSMQTKVFRLRYASAADTVLTTTGGPTRVEGVATVVGRLAGVPINDINKSASRADATQPGRMAGKLGKDAGPGTEQLRLGLDSLQLPDLDGEDGSIPMMPLPMIGLGNGPLPARTSGAAARTDAAARADAQAAAELRANTGAQAASARPGDSIVTAEPRLNAVIVRADRSRMPMFEELIEQLDVPSKMVEIEVEIFDIDSTRLQELGVDLRLTARKIDMTAAGNTAATGGGLVVSAVLGGANLLLQTRLRALEQSGEATIVSRPRILTMDNVKATLSNTSEFFVKLAGERTTNLFNVNYGLQMAVQPTVLGNPDNPSVQLAVQISDGGALAQQVDSLPSVTRNGLTTQGIVRSGDSLMIGGYAIERASSSLNRVPFLSDVPVVGRLFNSRTQTNSRRERVFLITPRVIEVGASVLPETTKAFPQTGMPNPPSLFPSLSFGAEAAPSIKLDTSMTRSLRLSDIVNEGANRGGASSGKAGARPAPNSPP